MVVMAHLARLLNSTGNPFHGPALANFRTVQSREVHKALVRADDDLVDALRDGRRRLHYTLHRRTAVDECEVDV